MTNWPARIPFDLKMKLEELAERRYAESDQDRWSAIKEWLEKHSVEAPERLPTEPEIENHWKWLDDVKQPSTPGPTTRTPGVLELKERKMIAKTIQEIVRKGEGLDSLEDAVNSNFSHLKDGERGEVLEIVENALLNLTPVQDVIYELTTSEIEAWNENAQHLARRSVS